MKRRKGSRYPGMGLMMRPIARRVRDGRDRLTSWLDRYGVACPVMIVRNDQMPHVTSPLASLITVITVITGYIKWRCKPVRCSGVLGAFDGSLMQPP
jgi:hypothetical protein